MTHKKGNEHWASECKRIREERDRLLLEIIELNKPEKIVKLENNDDKLTKLLKEILAMTSDYYANMDDIRDKIKKVIG